VEGNATFTRASNQKVALKQQNSERARAHMHRGESKWRGKKKIGNAHTATTAVE